MESEDVVSVLLEGVDGQALAGFTPGAHIDLHLPGGLVRQYSLINEPNDRYRVAVGLDRNSRGGSRYIHRVLRPGDRLRASAPRQTFSLDEDAPCSILIAGGVGITPLLAMARRLERTGRAWSLWYAARSRAAAAFWRELAALGGPRVHLHFDDEAGALIDLDEPLSTAPRGAQVYVCGPARMIEATRSRAAALELRPVRFEHFAPPPPTASDGAFVVELARSGLVLEAPVGKSILEVVTEAGVQAPSSCRAGVCGACETRVLEGVPDHRDALLSEAERASGETMLICCSRSLTPKLRLDL